MKLIDELIGRAVDAEKAMGELAKNEAAALERDQAYRKIEQLFDQAVEDGYLDAGEVEELTKAFRAQGLDTGALQKIAADLEGRDGVARTRADAEVRTQIRDQLREVRMANRNQDPFFEFKAQTLMAEHEQAVSLVANIQKSEHDKYMNAIRHLVA